MTLPREPGGVPRKHFGTDGVRGLANVELTPELALALGRAAARPSASASSGVSSTLARPRTPSVPKRSVMGARSAAEPPVYRFEY